MQVAQLYERLKRVKADPMRFDEIYPTITELDIDDTEQRKKILETILQLIVYHAELKGLSISKTPYKGEVRNDTISFRNLNLPDELKAILVAYLEL